PSKGVTSIYGIMPLSHTQDVIGPLAREVADLALVLDVVSGFDPQDPATEILDGQSAPGFVTGLDSRPLSGLRLGRFTDYFEQLDAPMARVLEQALEQLRSAGVEIVDVAIPDLAGVLGGSGVIGHEFRTDLDQYLTEFASREITSLNDVVSHGLYHNAVAGALLRSQSAVPDNESYQRALQLRLDLRQSIETMMRANDLDALVYPPISRLQVYTGENQPGNNCSLSANSGLPAIAVPAGFTPDGLPVGMELLGFFQDDVKLVSIAYQWERFVVPRRAPTTTPPLVDGLAPEPESISLQFNEGDVVIKLEIQTDVTRSRMVYSLLNESTDANDLYAAALAIDSQEPADPLIANLAGPAQQQAQGELWLSPQLLSAWQEHRLVLKIFGNGIAAEGIAVPLRQLQ
ncbi:MAG: amidase family protein, partial [Pseudohongiellaceae bacterium]